MSLFVVNRDGGENSLFANSRPAVIDSRFLQQLLNLPAVLGPSHSRLGESEVNVRASRTLMGFIHPLDRGL